MNSFHEVAMLAAQMWGDANAQSAEPEQFCCDVAQAYSSAFDLLGVFEGAADAIAYGVAAGPTDVTSELLQKIASRKVG